MTRRKRKRNGPKTTYVKGASWQDVLSGRPVTADEVGKQSRAKQQWRRVVHKCRRCAHAASIPIRVNARKPPTMYCFKCGGIMDRWAPTPATDGPGD